MKKYFFNYKNNRYSIEFFPCGNMARVTMYREGKEHDREFKFNRSVSVRQFLNTLEKTNFYF